MVKHQEVADGKEIPYTLGRTLYALLRKDISRRMHLPLTPVEVFCSYVEEDAPFQKVLERHLSMLQRSGAIVLWHQRKVTAGSDWKRDIDAHLNTASLILLLISPDFLASDYAYGVELQRAMQRHDDGQARVIPILLRPCDWEGAPFARFQILPRNREAITVESNLDQAFTEVAKEIRNALEDREGLTPRTSPAHLPKIWQVPYPRNPFFTGREQLLAQLAHALHTGQSTALSQSQAISGLGGIGKTQIAIEYAYQHEQDYQAVLWAQADTRENLTSSFLALASVLNLPERVASESTQVVAAVKQWLQVTPGYVLILDNADDLALAHDFLPTKRRGQVLLTTRAQVTGRFARRLEVEEFPREQGVLFLLRRAGLLAPDAAIEQAKEADRVVAQRLCEELGGLPLALDQAGAYIEETACGLAKYEQRYQQRRSKVLAERRSELVKDHPLPVAMTWNLSFEQVAQRSPAAADLLRVCVFLAPDAIPETILTKGAAHMGPRLAEVETDADVLDQAVEALRAYSLIQREVKDETTSLLSVHRLVQAVLKDQMTHEEQRQWTERVMNAVNAVFPEVEHRTWSQCEVLLPHALAMASLIEQYEMTTLEAARLLDRMAMYLKDRARYHEAEPLAVRALAIREQQQGAEHPDTATTSNNLALLYEKQGKYEQAEPLLVHALAIREQQQGAEHPQTAGNLNNLALLYYNQGKYAQAESLYVRVLAIYEQQLGAEHPNTALSLNNLAVLYYNQGKYEQAEPLYVRALAIREQQLGAEHPDTAATLNNLAGLYYNQGKYVQAESLHVRALAIREQQLGAEHPDTAATLNNLALFYKSQGKYEQAEPLYVRALAIYEQQLGAEHPNTAGTLTNLAVLYLSQGKEEQAEPLYVRALAIFENILGRNHPSTQAARANYFNLLLIMGRIAEAEHLKAEL